jgi:LysM repeat protein
MTSSAVAGRIEFQHQFGRRTISETESHTSDQTWRKPWVSILRRAKGGSHERKPTDEKTPLDDRPSSLETEKPETKRPDVLHFVDPATDSVSSVAIRYGVPAAILRRANALFSDHLLVARRTIVIPGEHYGGASLSPRPPGGEEEEARKGKIRRLMVRCKVAE